METKFSETTTTERATCTVQEAARRIGVSTATAYELIRSGRGDRFVPGGVLRIGDRRIVISVAALERFLSGGAASKS